LFQAGFEGAMEENPKARRGYTRDGRTGWPVAPFCGEDLSIVCADS
jgi:hypothetical protein